MTPSTQICPRFQIAVELLGKRWTGLVLHQLVAGPRRFSELASALEVSERVLSERLKELVQAGVVERRVLPDPPVKVEYRLTEKGQGLSEVVEAITHWAERWVEPPKPAAQPKRARRQAG